MAADAFMYFKAYNGQYMPCESQVTLPTGGQDLPQLFTPFNTALGKTGTFGNHCLFEIEDYSFDIEQTLNIGSQSSGAGAGKVTFNPFSITRKVDISSPSFFQMACAGTSFQEVGLGLRKSSGGAASGSFFLMFTFKLVAVKTISWAHDDEAPKETTTFEYGGMVISYAQQKTDGTFYTPPMQFGWNRVQNISDNVPSSPIGGSGMSTQGAGIPNGVS